MSEPTSSSAVRDAARLIAAAEELFDIAPDCGVAAAHIHEVAEASKALRSNHLDDVLAHVEMRAGRLDELRGPDAAAGVWTPQATLESSAEAGWAPVGRVTELTGALMQATEALRLTAEYVGPDGLPSLEGWSWWEALVRGRDVLGWDVLPADWRDPERDARRRAAVDGMVDTLEPEPSGAGPASPEDLERLAARVHGADDA
jgi:hypothetical protein